MLTKQSTYINKTFVVETSFSPLCCPGQFPMGLKLTVLSHLSPNRLTVKVTEDFNELFKTGWGHKVKRSSLNRCCRLLAYS